MEPTTPKLLQLHMLFPESRLADLPEARLPAGYLVRQYTPEDEDSYLCLMAAAGFEFDRQEMQVWLDRVLPDGFFLVEHQPTAQIVASAMATHHPLPLHPYGGELGWLAGNPAHAGIGLGTAVSIAVLTRFRRAGYHHIFLRTEDFRVPALKIYLTLGFLPFLYVHGIEERWRTICAQLKWPFTPQAWPRVPQTESSAKCPIIDV